MATSTVNVSVVTQVQIFPIEVQPTGFLFELLDKNQFVLSHVENPTPEASFPEVPQGEQYTMRVTRNGVVASIDFTVPKTVNDIAVPVSVSVSFA